VQVNGFDEVVVEGVVVLAGEDTVLADPILLDAGEPQDTGAPPDAGEPQEQ
jgi:hypothetical protein